MAIPCGALPTAMVADTVLVAVFITDTLFELRFATYTLLPSGLMATVLEPLPTAIVAITVLVVVLMTDTLFEL